ncbi:MAG: type II secretion system F family protein [Verrucomicrobia bacterium]|nr:type II secretion system F family protein [Verrucomicrobiota bacterium]
MAQFSYKARRRSGEVVQGVLDVVDRTAAVAQIEKLGLFPVAIDTGKGAAADKDGERKRGADFIESLPKPVRDFINRKPKPGMRDLATYTQQLANLLKAGMPLTGALGSMANLEFKAIPPEVSRQLRQDVMEGKSLSDAMARQPYIFSNIVINMVRAGEQSGALVDVLKRLGEHFERFADVQQKFTSAMIYPAIVACVGVTIVFVFMVEILPKFLTIFDGVKDFEMPMSTQMLIGLSHVFSRWWWMMILLVVVVIVVFKRFKASEFGARTLDRWTMNAPVIGKVVRLNLFGQFARTLSTLLQNGVPVLTALKITEQVIPNNIIKEAIAKTREAVTDGKTIAQPLATSRIFPQLMIDLIRIGEETGDVPGSLRNVADTYENELVLSLRVMTNLIEPALIILIACCVGFLLFSILSAMFKITSSIDRG